MAKTKTTAATVRRRSESELAGFIRDAARFYMHEPNDRRLIKRLNKRTDGRFLGERGTPSGILIDAIRTIADADLKIVRDALVLILKAPASDLRVERLHEIVAFLVEADIVVGDVIVNMAIDRLVTAPGDAAAAEDVGEGLVYLAGLESGGGDSAISVVEQLRKHGISSAQLAEAALRMVAKYDNTKLARAIRRLRCDLSLDSSDEWKKIVADLIGRSSLSDVLCAFSSLEPEVYPHLFLAAFGKSLDGGLFRLRRIDAQLDGEKTDKEMSLPLGVLYQDDGGLLTDYFDAGGRSADYRDWSSRLLCAVDYLPPVMICSPGSALSDLFGLPAIRLGQKDHASALQRLGEWASEIFSQMMPATSEAALEPGRG